MRWLIGGVLVLLLGAWGPPAFKPEISVRLEGNAVQGGLVVGRVAPGSEVRLDGREVMVDQDGRFLFGFGRDAGPEAELVIRHAGGAIERRTLGIAPRSFDIQRIDGLPPAKVTPRTPEEIARIQRDARAIARARARASSASGAFEPARWPVRGPVTGVFGSQRILNGQPRSPHKGVDVAAARGTPVGAMMSGTVSLAEHDMYFTGHTIMIDHGHGLHSIYAHLDALAVEAGDRVASGEVIGHVGSTGRATGPHLHFGAYWFQDALDPELMVGAMPSDAKGAREY